MIQDLVNFFQLISFRFNAFLLLLFIPFYSFADQEAEKAVQQKVDHYKEAFNSHDAKKIAEIWAEDGQYTNPETGQEIVGKSAIETFFNERFTLHPNSTLESETTHIEFPSPDEATLTGSFRLKESSQDDKTSAFKAYFKKQNNDWVLDEVREIDIAKAPDQYQHLKELEWLIGDWVDQDDDVEIKTHNQWDPSKNLIIGKFSLATEGKKELEGMQVIAWDPINKNIRSWIFDSDGAFGEARWIKKDSKWIVETSQVLGDGEAASATNIFTPVDQDSFKWESTEREVGGNLLPDINPVVVKRVKNEK